MKKVLVTLLMLALCLPLVVSAGTADIQSKLETAAGTLAVGEQDLPTIIGRLINVFIGLLGVIMVVLVLYGGYLWMTAAGDPEKVKKGRQIIIMASAGIIVILAAYAISTFVITEALKATAN